MKIDQDAADSFSATHTLVDGAEMRFVAQYVERERTGLHARVSLVLGQTVLAWTRFNVERDEDRVRLANSAYRQLERDSQVARDYPKEFLKYDLDVFCKGLEDALTDTVVLEDLAGSSDPSPPPFLIRPYLLHGGGTILFGPPGRGKSYTLLLLAVSLHHRISTLFDVPAAVKVLVINLERSAASMKLRLGSVNAALGLERTKTLPFINARGRSLADVAERVRKAVREQGINVVFLDSISRAGVGDLTENAPVNKITDLLNGLCPSWFALAHSPRGDDTHLFGSVHFDAAADVLIQLSSQIARQKWEVGIGLDITKANDFLPPEMRVLALQFSAEGLGLIGVRSSSLKEFTDLRGAQGGSTEDLAARYLERVGAATAAEIAEAIIRNKANTATALNASDRFTVSGKTSKSPVYSLAPSANGTVAHDARATNRATNEMAHPGASSGIRGLGSQTYLPDALKTRETGHSLPTVAQNSEGNESGQRSLAHARAETTSLGQGNEWPGAQENGGYTPSSGASLPSIAFGEGNDAEQLDDDSEDGVPF